MSASISGLARITIRAPRRRLDLSVPHQIPLAELLADVVVRAGEPASIQASASAWTLRRADGATLVADEPLATQGIRDGDVLYLVPRQVHWPEPAYDDLVEEIAESAREHGRLWDSAHTRLAAVVAAAVVLATGLATLFAEARPGPGTAGLIAAGVSAGLLLLGTLISRALGDGAVGVAAGVFAVVYAGAAGAWLSGAGPSISPADRVLAGSCAVVLASVMAAGLVGAGLRVFTVGVTSGLLVAAGAVLSFPVGPAGAAAVIVAVGAIGLAVAPALAVRFGRLPMPVVSAVAEHLDAEPRPSREELRLVVSRTDDLLSGLVGGFALAIGAGIGMLATTTGFASRLLALLAAMVLLLRARAFPSVAARSPLLVIGLLGVAALAVMTAGSTGAAGRLVVVAVGAVVVAALILLAARTRRPRADGSPYYGRIMDIVDTAAIVALVPVAFAVLDLYGWIRVLVS